MKLKPQFVMATPTAQNSIEFRMRIEGSENWSLTKHSRASMRLGKLFEAAEDLLEAAKAVLDPDPCHYDHDGDCQAHGITNPCEQKLLRDAIAKAEESNDA